MRILFLNRCYYPDVEATGQLLGELCTDLAQRHAITVIAGQPNFVADPTPRGLIWRESQDRVDVIRVRNSRFRKTSLIGRALGLLSYLLLAFWAALWQRRPQAIVVETDPPVLGAAGVFLKWWHRCPLIYYLQDLFPEVGLALGKFKPGPLVTLLHGLNQFALQHADRVIVLGEDMRQRVLARGIAPAKLVIVPNWVDADLIRPATAPNPLRREWDLADRFVVMYSGNLGLSQGLEHVLAAAQLLREEPVLFLFVGEGAAKPSLVAQAATLSLDNVRFVPYQPKEKLAQSLTLPDLHLIPLRRGLAGCIVPSKLYGILAAGVPYVAAVDADSEVAHVTRTHDTGLLIDPDHPGQLADAIRWCLQHRPELRRMGQRGRRLAETTFNRPTAVAQFDQVLRLLSTAPQTAAPPAWQGPRDLDRICPRARQYT